MQVHQLAWGTNRKVRLWLDEYIGDDHVGESGRLTGGFGKTVAWNTDTSGLPDTGLRLPSHLLAWRTSRGPSPRARLSTS